MKKLFVLTALCGVMIAPSHANSHKVTDTVMDGYRLINCQVSGETAINYCTTHKNRLKTMLKKVDFNKPNLDKDKVLMLDTLKRDKTANSPFVTTMLVFSKKDKTITLAPNYAWFDWQVKTQTGKYPIIPPKIATTANSPYLCGYEPYAWFSPIYNESGDNIEWTSPIVEKYNNQGKVSYSFPCLSFNEHGDNSFGLGTILDEQEFIRLFPKLKNVISQYPR